MNKIGIVEVVKINQVNTRNGVQDSFNVLMDGEWFNSFSKFDIVKGDSVSIEYKENGKYKNITNIVKQEQSINVKSIGQPDHVNSNVQTSIIRQNCLSHATAVVLASKTVKEYDVVDTIISVARELEAYVNS